MDALSPSATSTRTINLFDVPPAIAAASGVKEVGIVTLTADEELLCFKRSGSGNSAKLAMELAKTSLVSVDGKKLSLADGSADAFWKDVDPRLRQLILSAYSELHAAGEDDTEAFLKSRRVRVG